MQKPHPPVIMGGDGPRTFDRVVEFADGWMPIGARMRRDVPLADRIADLRRRLRDAGRDPDAVSVSIFFARPDRDTIDQLEQAGVQRVVFGLPAADRDTVLPLIDQYASLVR